MSLCVKSGWSNNPIIGELDSDLYLMFAMGDNDGHNNYISNPYCLYGWVHLNVDEQGRMNILSSVIGMEGQSMIVGAIPEPSAGVLLLLGLAALALRRRRESHAEQFSGKPGLCLVNHGGETCAGPYLAKKSGNSLNTTATKGVSPHGFPDGLSMLHDVNLLKIEEVDLTVYLQGEGGAQ